ncbi:MAG TPA: lysylphosphatidylglycerol synthase domain-containing protein [Gemmatimonadales bacterium]|nr:lysylphosphatidylglycerol synthase domain-containing protein [Gemmatimonadales bacterium]
MTNTRRWLWAIQGAVALVVVVLVARTVQRNWTEFRSLHVNLDVQPGWLALATLAVFLTYAFYIESWRRLLAGWAQRIPFGVAARVWSLSNLGRYVPGKIWSVTGLVVLAQRAGVRGGAAAASAVAFQALVLGTGVAVVAAATPQATSALRLVAGFGLALASLGVLVWGPTARWLGRLMSTASPLTPLPLSAVALAGALMFLGWLTYGVAFWLFVRGLLPDTHLTYAAAAGAFTLSYILGTLALFAPGGIGVRELVMISLLTPALGSGGAVAVSVGSRVLLTVTEAGAALLAIVLVRHSPPERPSESP